MTRLDCTEFSYSVEDLGTDENGFNYVYDPDSHIERSLLLVRVVTERGGVGEYVGRSAGISLAQIETFADYLLGKNPLERERHWSEINRSLRQYDGVGLAPVDVALWDYAGREYGAPIHELLGTYRERLPAYATTPQGDTNGGLDSPEAYADFAERCLELGYPAFKIHSWGGSDDQRDIDREVATIRAVGERVGDEMNLMHDPACEYETFADALTVGRAMDEYDYFWYEDPYRDGGVSQHSHRTLRQRLDTPLLQTEHVRSLEGHADFVASEATDFVRADPDFDGGITGATKIARTAEGFGLDVEFHAPGPAKRHCMAATRNTNYYELGLVHPVAPNPLDAPIYDGSYSEAIDVIDDDGTVPVPDDPGLGVEYDHEFIEANATRSVQYD